MLPPRTARTSWRQCHERVTLGVKSLPTPITMTTRVASCTCGQLSLTVTEDPVRISICHCLDCQRRTGSVFGAQARFRNGAVKVSGQSQKYVRIGDEGNKIVFHFCPKCGATVHWQMEGQDDRIAVAVGAFADPGFPAPTVSVYERRKHPWVGVPIDVEHLS
jgi:hypothetical protein